MSPRQTILRICLFFSALFGGTATTRAQLTNITGLFTTGVNASSVLLGNNVQETHYVITADTGGTPTGGGAYTVKTTALNGGWTANTSSARWVVADSGGSNPGNNASRAAGTYDYTLTFTMPAGGQLGTVSISGTGAADNSATIYVNGTLVSGQSITGSGSTNSFTLSSSNAAFTSGSNTITFRVNNTTSSDTGLMITSLSGTVIVPECGTMLPTAAAVGVYGLVSLLRRRRGRAPGV